MRCPKCSCVDDKVIDSRSSKDGLAIRRRRQCLECNQRFTTYEEIERGILMVIKDDGAREKFSREKLETGISVACEKRPISAEAIEEMTGMTMVQSKLGCFSHQTQALLTCPWRIRSQTGDEVR